LLKVRRHDIAEILLKVALNTINQIKSILKVRVTLQESVAVTSNNACTIDKSS